MTIRNGRFVPKSEEELMQAMLNAAEESWGRELTNDEEAVIVDFYTPIAEHFAEQQNDLRDVLDSAQLEHAEGQALDYLAGLIGVPRRQEREAEGRLRFVSDDPVTQTRTIPAGTGAQTDDTDAIRFNTDYTSEISYITGFEGSNILDDYVGDTGLFSQSNTAAVGDHSLTSSDAGEIANTSADIEFGSRFHFKMQSFQGGNAGFLFGFQDFDNYYEMRVDNNAGELSLRVYEDGTETVIDTASSTVPDGEWIDVRVDWALDGVHEIEALEADGTQMAQFEAEEAEVTYESGGYGFSLTDGSETYFDEVTMSYVSVAATATEIGDQTNLAPETLTILSSSLNGIDSVLNPLQTTGGRAREEDDDYRSRIQTDLAEGTNATLPAIINALDQIPETKTVTVISNRDSGADGDGRPGHSVESIVDAPEDSYEDIAQTLLDTIAAGDEAVGGYAGTEVTRTVELDNGQEEVIAFSTPTVVDVDVSVSIDVTDDYAGDERVESAIVRYVGGVLPSGDNVDGSLGVGDDVIYNKIISAIVSVPGVADVTSLDVNSGQSNITIDNTENASADGTDGSLSISASDV